MNAIKSTLVLVLLLLVAPLPTSAQEGLGAVVCVASELEMLANTGPVQRVVDKDVQVVYHVGVRLADQDEVEANLLEELSGPEETRCVRSDREHSHVVVVSYQAVVRGDLTIDPEDPRYRQFSVGYGRSWDEAEQYATRVSGRFMTNYDGGGYEVLVRESWAVAADAREAASRATETPEPDRGGGVPTAGGMGPGSVFRDCAACPEMAVVPAGSFMMGSPTSEEGRQENEGPQHRVTIGSPFAVGVYEVTFAEWDACVGAGGCGGYRPEDGGWGRGGRPVIHVNWEDAQAYLQWLSRETEEEYRLLSEAEWEYVARAGTTAARYWGDREAGQCRYENGFDRTGHAELDLDRDPVSCSDGYVLAAPVGLFEPNRFGLYDVLGNVREWTQDCWNESYSGAPADGSAWSSGDCLRPVLRGGSWLSIPGFLRSASRFRDSAGIRSLNVGFRVARDMY